MDNNLSALSSTDTRRVSMAMFESETPTTSTQKTPLPVWTLRIPMASFLALSTLLQIASSALTSDSSQNFPSSTSTSISNSGRTHNSGDANPIILPIVQSVVGVLTMAIYCLFIYPNTLAGFWGLRHGRGKKHRQSSAATTSPVETTVASGGGRTQTGRSTKSKRIEVARRWVVLALVVVYLFFTGQAIYEIQAGRPNRSGFIGWVLMLLNLTMAVLLAVDYVLQGRYQQRCLERPTDQDQEAEDEQRGQHSAMDLPGTRTESWAQAAEEDLPRYERNDSGRSREPVAVVEPEMALSVMISMADAEQDQRQGEGSTNRSDQARNALSPDQRQLSQLQLPLDHPSPPPPRYSSR